MLDLAVPLPRARCLSFLWSPYSIAPTRFLSDLIGTHLRRSCGLESRSNRRVDLTCTTEAKAETRVNLRLIHCQLKLWRLWIVTLLAAPAKRGPHDVIAQRTARYPGAPPRASGWPARTPQFSSKACLRESVRLVPVCNGLVSQFQRVCSRLPLRLTCQAATDTVAAFSPEPGEPSGTVAPTKVSHLSKICIPR